MVLLGSTRGGASASGPWQGRDDLPLSPHSFPYKTNMAAGMGAQPLGAEHLAFHAVDNRYWLLLFGLLWFRSIPDDPHPFKGEVKFIFGRPKIEEGIDLTGSLKDFGLTDIFQLLGQQQKTGVLTLQDDKEAKKVVQILFDKGTIVGTAFPSEPPEEPPVVKRLIRGGLISPEKWKKAYDQQKDQLISVESALLNNGMVIKEDLVAVLRLLTFETIYGLFKWEGGIFRFETKQISYDPDFVEPIPSEYLLLDVLGRVDEWPMVAERIPTFDMVLEKSNSMVTLDELVGTPWEEKRTVQMDVLYELVDGRRTIQEIIDLSFIGEFDACKDLIVMMDAGLIEPISIGASIEIEKGKKSEVPGRLRDAGMYFLFGVLVFFLIFQLSITRWADFPLSQEEREKLRAIQAPLGKIEKLKSMNAREVFFLEENRYPMNPSEMVKKGLLTR